MRHRKEGRKFGRETDQRAALLTNLADSLIIHNRIETTLAKAKELRRVVEPMVTKAKKGTVAARRVLISQLYTDKAIERLFNELGPKYQDRQGGYTRITKLGARATDAAEMAVIEFVD